ncbi:YciI family protein [Pseudonocardia aurantiaca]|uniref:YciI family protein n=1 Tax=Pseudonocardia aurantiaca TaxID=75290 RepID=A0ABW4FFI9_9PSEU
MRVMVIMKYDGQTENAAVPTPEYMEAMRSFNEELVKAGVLLAGEGLHPSEKGARVRFEAGGTSVIDGPFTEAKELVAGFWLWQVGSLEEGIEWLKRCPMPDDSPAEIEIRQVFETGDFGEEYTPEQREKDEELRAQVEGR